MTIDFLEKAHQIATIAHQGQVDKAGLDYIKHPETVASFVSSPEEKAAAYLHDVLEDTSVTRLDLAKAGIPQAVIHAVDILTKRQEPYDRYLARVKKNPIASAVKLADLKHNSDLSRLVVVTPQDLKRVEKYRKAIAFLNQKS